jgi:hypothetical protein
MAQHAVSGPLGEGDLRDESGLDPVGARLADVVGERRLGCAQFIEPGTQVEEGPMVEAGADLARQRSRSPPSYLRSSTPNPTGASAGSMKPPMTTPGRAST